MINRRQLERNLLMVAGIIMLNGILAVNLAHGVLNYQTLGAVTFIFAGFMAANIVLCKVGHTGDPLFLPLASLLVGIGLIIILRLKPELFMLQVMWVGVGLVAFLISAILAKRLEQIAYFKYICGFIGVGLLLSAILFGVDIGGNKNWIIMGPVRFQPSEFAKIFIVLFLAAYLSERRELLTLATKHYGPFVLPHPRFIAPLIAVWSLGMLMFVLQRDMGAALLYFGLAIIMTYMVSGRSSYVIIGMIAFLVGSVICYHLYSHIQLRVDIWLNPWSDPSGGAYQIVQSLFALGSGGIMGSGLTYGFPTMIPEVHTDFIFAAIGEEMGLIGAGAVILLYILMIYRAFRTSLLSLMPFSMMVAAGLAVSMALQTFLIIAGVIKFFPLTGITLPFISYGGSSIVSNFILLGMLFSISEVRGYDAK
ncbi:FtsW/RodA/SpoVE family cell cycle protein [Pelosinus propionicus]|uniref:Cell division protein FtsW, lipid II flippase n=1 Tax=Pelosinus propionicus DSM 13327 TaxID=1123291 RepID=A0A1I4L9S4_9FIRM|nr:FtsW/RodA/SpoVE family cell cycle protein [Pelosinus propionicus]SFL87397.1 cell division protein FtsW, lipid II flippase [Pelosinus propionicus DSM 13327]